jgi:hypothetical protein
VQRLGARLEGADAEARDRSLVLVQQADLLVLRESAHQVVDALVQRPLRVAERLALGACHRRCRDRQRDRRRHDRPPLPSRHELLP